MKRGDSLPKLDDFGFKEKEKVEVERLQNKVETDYPKPEKRFRLILESYTASIEEAYFWLLNHLRVDQGFSGVIKIADVFTAAEISAIGGTIQQRLASQQEKVATYLRGIHEMTKQLFQIVREVRILVERLEYYEKSKKTDEAGQNAEMALKDTWVTMVEGGTKNPASVFGLAQQVGFTVLPDVFFRTRKMPDESDEEFAKRISKMEFNEHFKDVLKRKLTQFYIWKEKTFKELDTRKRFQLKILRQYYNTIRLYMSWVKPYLKTIQRLGGRDISKLSKPDLIAAFENSIVELEFLAYKQTLEGPYKPIILVTFEYQTAPSMSYSADQFQRGPLHVGRMTMSLRSYIWTDEQIEKYRRYREAQDFEVLEDIDSSLKEAMDALGDEMKQYLMESGEKFPEKKEEKKEEKKQGVVKGALDPFVSIFRGFGELFGMSFEEGEKKKKKEEKPPSHLELSKHRKDAEAAIKFSLYQAYKNYKKAHGFLSW